MSVYGGLVPLGFDPFHSCDISANYISEDRIPRILPLDKRKAAVYDEVTISYAASCFASRLSLADRRRNKEIRLESGASSVAVSAGVHHPRREAAIGKLRR